jgi:hypothetical protein
LEQPLVVLLEQDGADQPGDAGLVGEDADDVGASFDLLIQALQRVGRRTRQLGIKQLRNELLRDHGLRLSLDTLYRVLVQHGRLDEWQHFWNWHRPHTLWADDLRSIGSAN